MYGSEVGTPHDITLYRESGMDDLLGEHWFVGGTQYCVYGDAAYMPRPWLQTAFPSTNASAAQLLYKKNRSSVREAAERSYKEVKQSRTSQDFRRKLKIREAPIALQYICSALLQKFKTCMGHGGEGATRVDIL